MKIEQRHAECSECRWFRENRVSARCLPCGAGEFFEPRPETDPNDEDLMRIYAGMTDER